MTLRVLVIACVGTLLGASQPAAAQACKADTDCARGELCDGGTCKAYFCSTLYAPVCGVDGNTYSNACFARLAHVPVYATGACPPGATTCGGIAGLECPEGKVCDFPPGTCDVVDNAGLCRVKPDICPEIEDPVCGCDGKTYGNDCKRLRSGVSLDHRGACRGKAGGEAAARALGGEKPFPWAPVEMAAGGESPYPWLLSEPGRYELVFANGTLAMGIECPLLRNLTSYSLTGLSDQDFQRWSGKSVCVAGLPVAYSYCMQGLETLSVVWIGECPRAP